MFENLKSINDQKTELAQQEAQKTERELTDLKSQEVFVKSIQSLANFIEGHTTKTVVMNQLKDYATSDDMESLAKFLRDILVETKKHENTDVQPVVDVLNQAVTELKALPKEQLEITFPEEKDYSEAFKQLLKATQDSIKAIQALKLNVEAPVVNVEAPEIEVEAPDLEPLGEDLKKSFKEAVKGIVFPKFDVSEVVKEQKKTTKAVDKMRDVLEQIPLGGGGGGGTSIAPFLNDDRELPVRTNPISSYLIVDEEDTGTYAYTGYENASGGWCIQRETLASGAYRYAAGTSSYSTAWTDRALQTYQYPSQTF